MFVGRFVGVLRGDEGKGGGGGWKVDRRKEGWVGGIG